MCTKTTFNAPIVGSSDAFSLRALYSEKKRGRLDYLNLALHRHFKSFNSIIPLCIADIREKKPRLALPRRFRGSALHYEPPPHTFGSFSIPQINSRERTDQPLSLKQQASHLQAIPSEPPSMGQNWTPQGIVSVILIIW